MQLVAHGSRDYVIVVGREALPSERYAAEELQHFLAAISGVALPIVDDGGEGHTHEILVGDSRRLRALGIDLAALDLGKEGFLLRTVGPRLVLANGCPRGPSMLSTPCIYMSGASRKLATIWCRS